MDYDNNVNGMTAKAKPGLAKVETGCSIYVTMPE
jgi:hypothetical protein